MQWLCEMEDDYLTHLQCLLLAEGAISLNHFYSHGLSYQSSYPHGKKVICTDRDLFLKDMSKIYRSASSHALVDVFCVFAADSKCSFLKQLLTPKKKNRRIMCRDLKMVENWFSSHL